MANSVDAARARPGSATAAPSFATAVRDAGRGPLTRGIVTTLQVNVGRVCNLACHHCHVEAGPTQTDAMDARVASRLIALLERNPDVALLDLTGGAPEMNVHFRELVIAARALGRRVIDRCNLTILLEPGYEDMGAFLASNQVEIVASLPCYTAGNVDQQRGRGVFDGSIEALRRLNALGYGQPGSGLALDLVYNPLGASLPPPQASLEATYRDELRRQFGLEFNRLLTITNMPIRRFAWTLAREGKSEAYMSLLVNHFNAATVPGLMCRSLVSVGWEGALYDCDFNQMLGLSIGAGARARTIWDVESFEALSGALIATAPHCFGCTAGAGSSCGGAIA